MTFPLPSHGKQALSNQPQETSTAPENGWKIYFPTIVGAGLIYLSVTMVNFALPSIQESLGLSTTESRWVIQGYSLVLAAFILVGGSLGDHYGRARIFMLGLAILAGASTVGALSSSLPFLLVSRIAQGLAGALIVPASLAIVSDAWSGAARGKAIGTWTGLTALGVSGGPVLGGLIVGQLGWRAVFWFNVPLALLALLACWRFVSESYDSSLTGRPDWPGGVAVTVAFAGLVVGTSEVTETGWTSWITIASLAIMVVALIVFYVVERRATDPMIRIAVFRTRVFSGSNALMLLVYGALGALLYFLPFNLTDVQGYSDTQAGLAVAPYVAIMVIGSRWSGGMVNKLGSRLPMTLGPVIASAGYLLFAWRSADGSYWTTVFPAATVLGTGMMITVAPVMTTVMSAVADRQAGFASGVVNSAARTGNVLAVALFSILMVFMFEDALNSRLDTMELGSETRTEIMESSSQLAEITPPERLTPQQESVLTEAIHAAFLHGFQWVMVGCAAVVLVGALIAALTVPGRKSGTRDS